MSMADCRAALLSSAEFVSGTVTVAAFAVATFAAAVVVVVVVVVAVANEEDAVKATSPDRSSFKCPTSRMETNGRR